MATTVSDRGTGTAHARLIQWAALANNEAGAASPELGHYRDRTIQCVCANYNGNTVTIEGSNDGTNWSTLHDPGGNNLTFTANGIKAILEAPLFVRPSVNNAGAATGINVMLLAGGLER